MSFDSKKIKADFPLLANSDWVFLDSGASSQKPKVVLDRIQKYYTVENANIHRGVYWLSEAATKAFEDSRKKVASFLGGVDFKEVVFTRGTTESINLVASGYGEKFLKPGDEILLTISEHHSNIVPWQILARKTGAVVKFIPLTDNYRLDMKAAKELVSEKTAIMSFAHVSNVLGVIHPVKELIALAKNVGAISIVDGAQSIPHFDVDVKGLGADFYAFSGHKMVAPTGIGVLYGRKELLEKMDPYQGGGDMISTVSVDGPVWNELPHKFEAGTPNISGAIGLGSAIDYLRSMPREEALKHDVKLGRRVFEALKGRPGIKTFYDGGDDWVGIVTFYSELIHPHDMAAICDTDKIGIRAGHHCAQPLMNALKVPATSRVSPYIYNTDEDIDIFLKAYDKAEKIFL